MFDKLEDLLIRFEEIMGELSSPGIADNQQRFRALMKEQSDLTPIVEAYKEYKACNETVEDSLAMLEEESDEEMREMLKEELNDAKKRIEELEHEVQTHEGCGSEVEYSVMKQWFIDIMNHKEDFIKIGNDIQ